MGFIHESPRLTPGLPLRRDRLSLRCVERGVILTVGWDDRVSSHQL